MSCSLAEVVVASRGVVKQCMLARYCVLSQRFRVFELHPRDSVTFMIGAWSGGISREEMGASTGLSYDAVKGLFLGSALLCRKMQGLYMSGSG